MAGRCAPGPEVVVVRTSCFLLLALRDARGRAASRAQSRSVAARPASRRCAATLPARLPRRPSSYAFARPRRCRATPATALRALACAQTKSASGSSTLHARSSPSCALRLVARSRSSSSVFERVARMPRRRSSLLPEPRRAKICPARLRSARGLVRSWIAVWTLQARRASCGTAMKGTVSPPSRAPRALAAARPGPAPRPDPPAEILQLAYSYTTRCALPPLNEVERGLRSSGHRGDQLVELVTVGSVEVDHHLDSVRGAAPNAPAGQHSLRSNRPGRRSAVPLATHRPATGAAARVEARLLALSSGAHDLEREVAPLASAALRRPDLPSRR